MSQQTPDETLLGLLMRQPQHGYQLLETFQDARALGRVWKLSTSQLYAVLKRLQAQGFIMGEEVTVKDAPTRTVYHITPSGRAYVLAWLGDEQPSASVRRVRVEFLSRLYVAIQLDMPTADLIEHQRKVLDDKYTQLIRERDQAGGRFGAVALELEIAQLEAILRWMTHFNTIHYNR